MANSDLIRGGTATVDADGLTVTGQGISWANVREGDFFGAHRGLSVPIEKIEGNVITLAYPWRGPAQNAAPYAIQPKADAVRFQGTARELIELLAGGELHAIAAAGSGPNKLPYFTGEGAAALAELSAVARDYLAANFYPVQQGGGLNQQGDKVRIGWASNPRWGLKLQVGSDDKGYFWTDADAAILAAANGYHKLPSGILLQWGTASGGNGDANITFPTAFNSVWFIGTNIFRSGAPGTDFFGAFFENVLQTGFRAKRRVLRNGGEVSSALENVNWFALGV